SFHLKRSRREQRHSTARRSDRIQMIPAILFGAEHQSVVVPIDERLGCSQFWREIARVLSTPPDFLALARRRVCHPDRPGRRAYRNEWQLFLLARDSCVGNVPPVGRPAGHEIAIRARSQIADTVVSEVVYRNKAVIASVADQ